MIRCAQGVVRLLEAYGVEYVFGIPGIHTVELYRALESSEVRHISPRHEQGAGFMADGYARVSGRPGVCFTITGPGITNIATAMAQAFSDSVPMLVISSVNRSDELALGAGQLHELPSQRSLTSQYTEFSHTVLAADELPEVFARAFAVFASRRPAPVHIEIPIDVMQQPCTEQLAAWPLVGRPVPEKAELERAAETLAASHRPLMILGGGAVDAGEPALELAQKLAMPVVNTVAAKGVVAGNHPLVLDDTIAYPPVRDLIARTDVLLAAGTEFSETDRYGDERPLRMGGRLIRIDIDPEQLMRNHRPHLPLLGDACGSLRLLAELIGKKGGPAVKGEGAATVAGIRKRLATFNKFTALLQALRRALPPETIIAGDSTQPVYAANSFFPMALPRRWITSVTGYGTLGYALPAAIGAAVARPESPVACIVGDGGLMFTLPELAVAVERALTLPVIVWNNHGYGEIREYMKERGIRPLGVDLYTPDLPLVARAFGCDASRARDLEHLEELVAGALEASRPTLIEVVEEEALAA